MPFIDIPGFVYGDPFEWYDETVEVVQARPGTGEETYIDPSGPGGVEFASPFVFQGGTVGNVDYRRDFAGDFPQIDGALDVAWQYAREGRSATEVWPDRTIPPGAGGIGSATHKGARYLLHADEEDPLSAGNGVNATSGTGGFSLHPANDLFDAWDNHVFATDATPDGDPTILAAYEAALAATPPGWSVFLESPWPIFLGYQWACDEIENSDPIYTTAPSGTILVGLQATGLGLASIDEDGTPIWVGPGTFAAPWVTNYAGGGAGSWIDPPTDTIPTQDPSTGQLLAGDDPWLVLNTFINFQAMLSGGSIVPDPGSVGPNGFDIHLEAERSQLVFAAKSLWRTPLMRYGRESLGITPPRRIGLGRGDGLTGGAARVLGGGATVQSGGRGVGGIL